jgi:hypothetical protein
LPLPRDTWRFDSETNGRLLHHRPDLKQTAFGMKPISIGGKTNKVKNEVEIDFQIFPN